MEDVRFESKIAALGVSPEGAKWLSQALYPPGSVTKTAIPDGGFHPSLRYDSRPSVVVAAPPGDADTWDLLVVTTPGDVNAAHWVAVRAVDVDFAMSRAAMPGALATVTKQGQLTTIDALGPQARTALGSTWFHDEDEDLHVVSMQQACLTRLNPLDPISFRSTYRSLTAHLTASDLHNGGTVTSAQFDAGLVPSNALVTGAPLPAPSTRCPLYKRYSGFMPLSEMQMTRSVPNTRVDEAKHGVYVPCRMLGPTQPFAHSEMSPGHLAIGSPSPYVVGEMITGPVRTVHPIPSTVSFHGAVVTPRDVGATCWDLPWWLAEAISSDNPMTLDTAFDNTACSVTIFRGLSPSATVTLTAYVGLQHIVRQGSPFAPLIENSPVEDMRAVEAYYRIAHSLRGSYPAKYNSLGLVVGALGNVLKTYGPTVARHLVSAFAPAVVDKVSSFIAEKPQQPFTKPKPPPRLTLPQRHARAPGRARSVRSASASSRGSRVSVKPRTKKRVRIR